MYDNGYGTDPYGYQPQPQPRPSRASSFLRTVLSVLVLVVLVVLLSWGLRTFVFQAYEIPSGSMEETIMPGDMVFSEKITYYGSDPAPGDIVTFQDPDPEQGGRILIKRVIAVGGQTVDLRDGRVYVDGVLQDPTTGLPSTTPTRCPPAACGLWGTTAPIPRIPVTSAPSRSRASRARRYSSTGR